MLEITIPPCEMYDERTNTFVNKKGQSLTLEHSLLSLQKWESIHHKPFLSNDPKTVEETKSYIKCMTITPNVDPDVYDRLTTENIGAVNAYIENSMTATTFRNHNGAGRHSSEVMTAEIIYYDMIALQIPFECKKWHLNQLLTLINVCSIKNEPPKKMSKSAIMSHNSSLNAARRAALHSRG